MNKSRVALLALTAAVSASAAHAGSTWSFSDTAPPAPCTGGGTGYTCTATGTATTVAVTGWSSTGSGGAFATATVGTNDPNGFGVKNAAEITAAGGNVNNVGSPEHAMDNLNNTDLLLLSFSASVALEKVTIGWKGSDSDITVLRYTGGSAPVLAGKTQSNLLTSGWSLVGSYADLVAGVDKTVNGTAATSSWWLISAYNSTFGGGAGWATSDAVKLLSVAATITTPPNNTGVPEPASLALAGAALMAMVGVNRRRKAVGKA